MKLYLSTLLFILSINPTFSQNSEELKNAEQYYKTGNYVQAIDLYEKALIDDPKNSYIQGQIGFAYLFLKKYEQSKLNFTEAIMLDSTIADYYNGRGLAAAYMSDVNSAIGDFSTAIKYDPTFSHAYLNRGSAYTTIANNDLAINDLLEAEKLDKKNPDVNYQLARLYYKKLDYAKSIENYNIAEKKGIKTDDLSLSRASVYYKMNNYEMAIKEYSSIIKKNPNNTDALNNRAVMYEALGKKDLAQKDRESLYKITGVKFKDPASYKYKKVTSKNEYFSLNIPTNWELVNTSTDTEENMVITISQKENNPRFEVVTVTLSYNTEMQDRYGISGEGELMNFWQQSQIKNTQNYLEYSIISQKQFMLNGWKAINFITTSQKSEEEYKFNMYEVVLAKENQLFYGYFQSPAVDFSYYQPIFEKILKSILIKGK